MDQGRRLRGQLWQQRGRKEASLQGTLIGGAGGAAEASVQTLAVQMGH